MHMEVYPRWHHIKASIIISCLREPQFHRTGSLRLGSEQNSSSIWFYTLCLSSHIYNAAKWRPAEQMGPIGADLTPNSLLEQNCTSNYNYSFYPQSMGQAKTPPNGSCSWTCSHENQWASRFSVGQCRLTTSHSISVTQKQGPSSLVVSL